MLIQVAANEYNRVQLYNNNFETPKNYKKTLNNFIIALESPPKIKYFMQNLFYILYMNQSKTFFSEHGISLLQFAYKKITGIKRTDVEVIYDSSMFLYLLFIISELFFHDLYLKKKIQDENIYYEVVQGMFPAMRI